MLYAIVITVAAFCIAATVSLACNVGFFYALGLTAFGVVLSVLVDGSVAAVCRLLPKPCADFQKKIYAVSAKEKKFYERLKIRKWKDKIPEIGHFTGFRKNKIAQPKSAEYLHRFLSEICYGELGHFFSLFFAYSILLLYPISEVWLVVALPVATVNALLNLLPIFVLRYNFYKLKILYESLRKKGE